jgi:cell division ATPase FtsA
LNFFFSPSFDEIMKKRLVLYFKKQILLKKQREKVLSEKYDELFDVWQRKVDKYENSNSKKVRDARTREFYEKVFPEIRKQREEKERLYQK